MHSLHFLLELEEPIHESLGSWRTAWDVDIHGNNPVAASDHGVAVVIVTSTVGTAAHAHHPSGLGHLAMSYLGAAICIISTAQQARPKVRGHNEPFLPQFTKSSTLANAHSTLFSLKSTLKGEYP